MRAKPITITPQPSTNPTNGISSKTKQRDNAVSLSSKEATFDIVDISSDTYPQNEGHLAKFYHGLMEPSFIKFPNELDPIESWICALKKRVTSNSVCMHAVLAVSKHKTAKTKGKQTENEKTEEILGGLTCEYYPTSQTGLLAYIATDPKHKGKGIARALVEEMVRVLQNEAQRHGHGSCKAIFVETNDCRKVKQENDIMDPVARHQILEKLGFRFLDFEYVQPPLSSDMGHCDILVLGVYNRSLIEDKGVDKQVTRAFLCEYYQATMGKESDVMLTKMMDRLDDDAMCTIIPFL